LKLNKRARYLLDPVGRNTAPAIALACRWTVRLLADKMVELQMVPSVSPMTVRNTLKKLNLSLT